MEYFQKIRHVDGVPKTHLAQSHEYIFWHDTRKLGVKNRRDQGDGHMIPTKFSGFCRRCAHRTRIADPDTLAAPNALTDDADRPFVNHANGFGRAGPDA